MNLRVRYGKPTVVTVDIAAGRHRRAGAGEITVRDLLVAGIGDLIAAGEGDPDRPVALSDDGFCFRSFIATGRPEYFRPGRVGFKGDKACDSARDASTQMAEWSRPPRAGCPPPATARSTATSCARRSGSRSRTRMSP